MSNACFLVVDVGTQSIRTALVSEGLEVLALHSDPQQITSHPDGNRIEVNLPFIWQSFCAGSRAVVAKSGIDPARIKGICVGAIMHSPVPVGRDGSLLLEDVQIYSDKRCKGFVDEFAAGNYAAEGYQKTGSVTATSWLGFKIRWIKEHQPEIYSNTWQFLTAGGWLNYKLTGAATIDHTEASGAYLVDRFTGEYDPELAVRVGVDLAKMPTIRNSAEVIGTVLPAAAKAAGIPAGIPVVAGSGDMGCAALGGNLDPGNGIVTTGTASGADLFYMEPVMDKRLINLRHVIDGWLSFGSVDCCGGSMRWLKSALFPGREQALAAEGGNLNQEIDRTAAAVRPGADGLLYLPQLLGERENLGSPNSKGAFIGISMDTGLPEFCRAVLEGVCYAERRILDAYADNGLKPAFLYSRGGGAKSRVWNQIRCDIYQIPIHILAQADNTGLLGAAIIAGFGVGVYGDIRQTARRLVRVEEIYTPNPDNAAVYNLMCSAYNEAHDKLLGAYDTLARARGL